MKNFRISRNTIAAALLGLTLTVSSCVDDLRQEPVTEVTAAVLYRDFANYKSLLAKLYGGLALGGQDSGDGNGDIAGIDGGFSIYTRLLYTMQVITTDEAVIGWNDG
jgi:hypothetical protein